MDERRLEKDNIAKVENFVQIVLVFVMLHIALCQQHKSNARQTDANAGVSDRHYWIINPATGHN